MRTRRCWYFRSISTGPVDWVIAAMVESRTGRSLAVTKSRWRSSGVCRYGSLRLDIRSLLLPVRGDGRIVGRQLEVQFLLHVAARGALTIQRLSAAALSP